METVNELLIFDKIEDISKETKDDIIIVLQCII